MVCLVLRYSSDTEDVFGIRMYRALRLYIRPTRSSVLTIRASGRLARRYTLRVCVLHGRVHLVQPRHPSSSDAPQISRACLTGLDGCSHTLLPVRNAMHSARVPYRESGVLSPPRAQRLLRGCWLSTVRERALPPSDCTLCVYGVSYRERCACVATLPDRYARCICGVPYGEECAADMILGSGGDGMPDLMSRGFV
jgi:hypothetical protein